MKLPEPNFERFLKVVRRQGEPDRVPFAELFHDPEIMTAIAGQPADDSVEAQAAWRIKFWQDLGYDYVTYGANVAFPSESARFADDTAELSSRQQRYWAEESTGPIMSWEDFEKYKWPEVTPAAFADMEAAGKLLPDGMKLVGILPCGPFENLTILMGYECFSYALIDQPDLVAAVAERVGDILCQIAEYGASMDCIGAHWLNDDLGFKNGPLASPEAMRTYVFPYQKRICEIVHKSGKPILMHSCGKLDVIMDDLIDDVGIDAKHSFEDVIMPVWEAKQKWCQRVALVGGVDVDVLARGSEDQVRAYTRRCIEGCAPGGGWALGSGNSVANYIPAGNFLAMLDEGWKCGRYN